MSAKKYTLFGDHLVGLSLELFVVPLKPIEKLMRAPCRKFGERLEQLRLVPLSWEQSTLPFAFLSDQKNPSKQ